MIVGVPKEIKNNEFRVGLTPEAVHELVSQGHSVVVQTGAGAGIDLTDEQYESAGARLAPSPEAVFEQSEMIVKVKEPQAIERALLRPRHTLFTYLPAEHAGAAGADVHREKQALGVSRFLRGLHGDPRLHGHGMRGGVDLLDRVHSLE